MAQIIREGTNIVPAGVFDHHCVAFGCQGERFTRILFEKDGRRGNVDQSYQPGFPGFFEKI